MKGLFFSSRSLSMSPPDLLDDERHKSKLKHREENVKLSPRLKFKRDRVTKNSDSKSTDSSTFQRCKKLISFKRFSVQDRLKRIRSNAPLQSKIIDQVCSETDVNSQDESKNAETSDTCDLNRNFKLLQEPCLQFRSNAQGRSATESLPKTKYSADSRLKKIKAAFQKKIMLKKSAELKTEKNVSDECHTENPTCSVSSDLSQKILGDGVLEFERSNLGKISGMDIDQECDFNREASDNRDNTESAYEEITGSSSPESSSDRFVEKICGYRNDRAYLALHENFAPDVMMNPVVPSGDLFIVLDTNILLSQLSLVRKLLISNIPPYKTHIVVIPWLVLQEIDYIIKKNDPEVVPRARAANIFLYDYLKKKHPRLFGQSLEDFKTTYKSAVSVDDCILQYCLKFTSLEKNVILLTDDINLCNKSMVNNLSVLTTNEFERSFFHN